MFCLSSLFRRRFCIPATNFTCCSIGLTPHYFMWGKSESTCIDRLFVNTYTYAQLGFTTSPKTLIKPWFHLIVFFTTSRTHSIIKQTWSLNISVKLAIPEIFVLTRTGLSNKHTQEKFVGFCQDSKKITTWSAVECSITELCPQTFSLQWIWLYIVESRHQDWVLIFHKCAHGFYMCMVFQYRKFFNDQLDKNV